MIPVKVSQLSVTIKTLHARRLAVMKRPEANCYPASKVEVPVSPDI